VTGLFPTTAADNGNYYANKNSKSNDASHNCYNSAKRERGLWADEQLAKIDGCVHLGRKHKALREFFISEPIQNGNGRIALYSS